MTVFGDKRFVAIVNIFEKYLSPFDELRKKRDEVIRDIGKHTDTCSTNYFDNVHQVGLVRIKKTGIDCITKILRSSYV